MPTEPLIAKNRAGRDLEPLPLLRFLLRHRRPTAVRFYCEDAETLTTSPLPLGGAWGGGVCTGPDFENGKERRKRLRKTISGRVRFLSELFQPSTLRFAKGSFSTVLSA
jgi:hypothetical protein